ncbi:MAG: pyridoxal phosphate-dependent decarboxylase family protein, partial [Caulobacteraceae bacterium]
MGEAARLTAPDEGEPAAGLDPADWDVFGAAAHAALERSLARLRHIGEGPVWTPTPAGVRRRFETPLPRRARDFEAVLDDVERLIAPYAVGNTHPRFFGWAHGAGTPAGMVAELLAAGLNANCGGRDHIGPVVERQAALWAAEAFGFPRESSGVFVTGSSQANFLGLLAARDAALGHEVRAKGLRAGGRQLCAYGSVEAHACVRQAMELAGVGADFLRRVATDASGAM